MWFMVGFLTNDVLQRIEASKTDDIVWHVVMLGLCVLFVAVDALWVNVPHKARRDSGVALDAIVRQEGGGE